MINPNPLPPLEELKEAFEYNPNTGLFTNKKTRRRARKGDIAGSLSTGGYIRLKFHGVTYPAHRMAWLFSTGDDPADLFIDHRDRVTTHNWISNLRLCTNETNQANTISKGWSKKGARFQARLKIGGKYTYLGHYATSEEASAVFQQRHIEEYGEFSPYLTQ